MSISNRVIETQPPSSSYDGFQALGLAIAAVLTVLMVNQVSVALVERISPVEVAERIRTLIWAVGTIIFIALGSVAVGTTARIVAKRAGLSQVEQRKVYWGFLFTAPWLIGFFIFVLGPALASLYYSFTDYELGKTPEWVGLENFRILLTGTGAHGRRFAQALNNSFYYALVGVPLQILTALAMALLLNLALKGMRVFRLIFYVPVILAGGPAVLLAWRYMFAANGGFINETMQNLAQNFFLFDWIYRFFLFTVEGFNGFYAGIARGDPVGSFTYTIPALIGALAVFSLVRGDWEPGKRNRAQQIAEVIGIIVIVILMARALITEPLDPAFIYISGILMIGGILANTYQNKSPRVWQISTLVMVGVSTLIVLLSGAQPVYLLALALIIAPVIFSMIGQWTRTKTIVLLGAVGVYCVLMFVQVAPVELAGARILPNLLTLTSPMEQPDTLEYLDETYPNSIMSPLWVWGAVALVCGLVAWFNNRYPLTQRRVLIVLLVLFTLLTIGSFIDGVRYFNAHQTVAEAAGKPNYHFSLFRQSTGTLPTNDQVPLWLRSELWSKPSLILITLWSSGASMLIFLAALKGVPQSFYEAAKVDGANQWQRFFKITLPLISPAIFYNVVIGIIAALQTFETIYIMQNTETVDSLRSAAFFLYERTFRQLAIGQGSSASWILAVIIVLVTVLQFRYSNWVNYEV